jgi:hypothetical protein
MSNVAYLNEKKYITRSGAHYKYRISFNTIARLIRERKVALHLIEGKVMLEADEVAREIIKLRSCTRNDVDLFA